MENSIPTKRKRCYTSLLKGVPQHGNTGRISQWTLCISHLWTHYHLNNITWYKCRHDGWETQWPWNLSAFLTFVHVMFLRWWGVHKCETPCSQRILQTINGESTGIRKDSPHSRLHKHLWLLQLQGFFFYIFIVCKREIIWCLVRFFKHSWASIKMTRWFQSVCYLVLYKYHWHVWLEYFFDEHRYFYSISFWNNCWWNHSTKQIRKWKNLINYIVGTYITSDQMTCNSGNERCF